MIQIIKVPNNGDLSPCFYIRRQVFIVEQNVPENLEIDGLDDQAWHYLLSGENLPVGTARVRFPTMEQAKIERVAVLNQYQGRGLGRQLMEFILIDLRQQKHLKTVILGAQVQVIHFYEKLGFKAWGEVFLDADIEHRMMSLNLN